MGIVVQKFGGSSVASVEAMTLCARRVRDAAAAGKSVVVVVSAMGDTTDELIALAERASRRPDGRELDQLLATGEQASTALMAMVLQTCGVDAMSMTGAQVGIRTDGAHTRAVITTVDRTRLEAELSRGRVAVVAGFQGVSPDGDVTTLGRGGSDTTAVALAASLGAESCDIYKDVEGVYTADPRLVSGARRRERVSYDELLEAASMGAQVVHPRAVELAKKHGVAVRVLHSVVDGPGTLIGAEDGVLEARVVSSVVLKRGVGRVTLVGLPNRAGVQGEVFRPIAEAGVSVDDIIQEDDAPGTMNLAFTVSRGDMERVGPIAQGVSHRLGGAGMRLDVGLAAVSAVGAGMRTNSGVAARMFEALGGAGVRIENITTSEIRITVIVGEEHGEAALRAVHEAFGLSSEAAERAVAEGLTGRGAIGNRQ